MITPVSTDSKAIATWILAAQVDTVEIRPVIEVAGLPENQCLPRATSNHYDPKDTN